MDEVGVVGPGEALGLLDAVFVDGGEGRGAFDGASVDDVDAGSDGEGGAGEAAVSVWTGGSWGEGEGEECPVEHVGGDGVVPAHVSPDGGEGVVLEEHVVVAVEVDGAVGVVHPVFGWK